MSYEKYWKSLENNYNWLDLMGIFGMGIFVGFYITLLALGYYVY